MNASSSNTSIINDEKSFTKGRTFSINHYDIYRPGFLVNKQEI